MLPTGSISRAAVRRAVSVALFVGVLAAGVWIVDRFPVLYHWDPYERIAHRDALLVRRWLPALQALIFGVTRFTDSVPVLRWVLCAVAAGAVVAAYRFGRGLGTELGAALGAVWLATERMFVEVATLPYQEPLFVLALCAGFCGVARAEGGDVRAGRWGAVALSVACLTRYEGWLALAALALERLWRTRDLRQTARFAAAHGGVVIVAWLLFGVVELSAAEASLERRLDPAYFVDTTRTYAGFLRYEGGYVTLVLGLLGWGLAWRDERTRTWARRLALFLALDVATVVLVDPFSGARRVFVGVFLLSLFAGQAVGRAAHHALWRPSGEARAPWLRWGALVLLGALAVPQLVRRVSGGLRSVRASSGDPVLVDTYEVGQWLDGNAADGAVVVVNLELSESVRVLALETWTRCVVEGRAAHWRDVGRPDYVVDFGGDRERFGAYLDELRRSAAVGLVHAPRGADGPRILRVRPARSVP